MHIRDHSAYVDQSIEVHLRKLDDPLVLHRQVSAPMQLCLTKNSLQLQRIPLNSRAQCENYVI